jgi:predicted ester cyclase
MLAFPVAGGQPTQKEEPDMRRTVIPVVVFVAVLLGVFTVQRGSIVAAQDATPAAADCPTTTVDENKALVTQLYEALGSGNDQALTGLMAENLEFYTAGGGEREGSSAGLFAGQRKSVPDATVKVDQLVAEGEWVVVYTSWSGTIQGDTAMFFGEEIKVPEAGLKTDWVSTVFFRIECGKISEVWPVVDRLHQLRNLGVLTEEDFQKAPSMATPAP